MSLAGSAAAASLRTGAMLQILIVLSALPSGGAAGERALRQPARSAAAGEREREMGGGETHHHRL